MKKFFKGVINLMLRHKILTLICVASLVVVVVLVCVFFNMFIGDGGEYGNRLDGIEEVEISDKTIKEIENSLEEKEAVAEADVRIQGKIIYFNIVFTRETAIDSAKGIANETLAAFSDDEKSFYDFGYFLTQVKVEDSEDVGFVVTGTKNAKLENITWIKSQVEV